MANPKTMMQGIGGLFNKAREKMPGSIAEAADRAGTAAGRGYARMKPHLEEGLLESGLLDKGIGAVKPHVARGYEKAKPYVEEGLINKMRKDKADAPTTDKEVVDMVDEIEADEIASEIKSVDMAIDSVGRHLISSVKNTADEENLIQFLESQLIKKYQLQGLSRREASVRMPQDILDILERYNAFDPIKKRALDRVENNPEVMMKGI